MKKVEGGRDISARFAKYWRLDFGNQNKIKTSLIVSHRLVFVRATAQSASAALFYFILLLALKSVAFLLWLFRRPEPHKFLKASLTASSRAIRC